MNRIELAADSSIELAPLRGPEGIVPIACTPWLAVGAGAIFGYYLANAGRKALEDGIEASFAAEAHDMSVGDLLKNRRDAISG